MAAIKKSRLIYSLLLLGFLAIPALAQTVPVPVVPPVCVGSDKALQWTGTAWDCATIGGSSSPTLFSVPLYLASGVVADSDGSSSTTMRLSAQLLVLYSPALGTTHSVFGSSNLPCDISVVGAGGRDQSAAFSAGADVWEYWMWGATTGLTTIASLSPPPAGPTLPSGNTHFAPAFVIKVFAGPSIILPLPQGGSSVVQVRERNVSYPNVPHIGGSLTVPGGVLTMTFDLSAWIPAAAHLSRLSMDAEIHAPTGGAQGGAVPSTSLGNFSNLSLYPPSVGWAPSNPMITTVLPPNRQMTFSYTSTAGIIDNLIGVVFVNGYTF